MGGTQTLGCSWPPQDNGRTNEANSGSQCIPSVGLDTFREPQPKEGRQNINAAIGRVSAPSMLDVNERQQVGEKAQEKHAGNEPKWRPIEPKPRPKGEAPCDFSKSGTDVNE